VSTSLAGLVAMRGDFAHARALYADAGAVYDELGLRLPRIGWTEVVAGVELLAGDPVEAIRILRHGYEILDIGGLEGLRLYHAAFLAFVLAGEGERGAAVLMTRACESCLGAPDPVATARLRGAQARIASSESERERLARDAIDAAECTDDLNLRAEMRLLLAQVLGEPAEAATARRLFEAKGNVAGAASTGLWSFQR
jgi:hypothetical protein